MQGVPPGWVVVDTGASSPVASAAALHEFVKTANRLYGFKAKVSPTMAKYRLGNASVEKAQDNIRISFCMNSIQGELSIDRLAHKPGRHTPILIGIAQLSALGIQTNWETLTWSSSILGISEGPI